MKATYRLPRSVCWVGVGSIGMAGWFSTMLYFILREGSKAAFLSQCFLVVVGLGVVAFLGFGGIGILIAVVRQRLTIDGNTVEYHGVFRSGRLDLSQVREARWRTTPRGLLLIGEGAKIKIDFTDYPSAQKRELIRFFRMQLPEDVQKNWSRFWQRSWRLFDEPDPARREEFAAKTKAMRRRLVAAAAIAAALIVAGCLGAWMVTGSVNSLKGLIAIVALTPILLLVRLTTAARGKIADRHEILYGKASRLTIVGFFVLGLSFMAGLSLVILPLYFLPWAVCRDFEFYGRGVLMGGGILGVIILAVDVIPRSRLMRDALRLAAKQAEEEYMRRP